MNWEETVKSVIAITTEYVLDFKSRIARQFGNPPIHQTNLMCNNQNLDDKDNLSLYNLQDGLNVDMAIDTQKTHFPQFNPSVEFIEPSPKDSIVNTVYINNLKMLSKVRETCGGKLDLPQLVVIGSTSQGKSTALGLITGLMFPTNTDVCTVAPCVVECKNNSRSTKDEYYITNPKTKKESPCNTLEELMHEIDTAQNDISKNEDGEKHISEDEIRVKVVGPSRDDLILIDLPGLIVNGTDDEKKRVRTLIERYCSSERSLLLVVSTAAENEKNIEAVDIARKYDPLGKRTLRILSKFDVFDSPESKSRAVEMVCANALLDLGPHAIIARTSEKEVYDPKTENRVFERMSSTLPTMRRGVSALRARLSPLFAQLINTNLNPLLADVRYKLHEAISEVQNIGQEPLSTEILLNRCQDALDNDLFGRLITPSLEKLKENVYKVERDITIDWSSNKLAKDVTQIPFFRGEDAFLKCFGDINLWWRPKLDDFISSAQTALKTSVTSTIDNCNVPRHLKEIVKKQWILNCDNDILPTFKSDCYKVLMEEINFGSMNDYVTGTFGEEIVLPEELLNTALERIKISGYDLEYGGAHISERFKTKIKDAFLQAREEWASKYSAKTLHEQQSRRLFAAVKAAFAVEKKSFIDNIYKKTTTLLRDKRNKWVRIGLLTNDEIRKNANEDVVTKTKRNNLISTINELKTCESIICSID